MSFTVGNLKGDLSRKLHGTSLRKLSDVYGLINEAARTILSEVDFNETKRTYQMINPIYNNIYDYILPDDLKESKIIDIYPFSDNGLSNKNYRIGSSDFDMNKADGSFDISYRDGQRWLRCSKRTSEEGTTISEMDGETVFSPLFATTEIALDTVFGMSGDSIKVKAGDSFADLGMENSTLPAIDLSSSEGKGSFFIYVYIPDISYFQRVILYIGSSTSDYWELRADEANGGLSVVEGWNLFKLDWDLYGTVGAPDSSSLTYLAISVLRSEGIAQDEYYRFDSLVYKNGSAYLIDYYSSYIFTDNSSFFKEATDSDDDYIILSPSGYNILLAKCEELAAQELQGEDSAFDSSVAEKKYVQARDKYKRENKSEYKKKRLTYYNV